MKEGRLAEANGTATGGATSVDGVIARTLADLLAVYRQRDALEFTALAMTEVYGPRQRPDGGIVGRLAAALASGEPAELPGDGASGV